MATTVSIQENSTVTVTSSISFDNFTSDGQNHTNVTDIPNEDADDTKAFLKQIYDIWIIVILCVVMFSLGCNIKLKVLIAGLKRPIGIIIGLICQFIVFPAMTFGLTHALQLERWVAIGMVLLGTSPGGSASNLLTYYALGDVTLSVTMTTMSTVFGIGMMPLNAWIYTRSWAEHKTVIPVVKIMVGLASMLIPVGIGILIRAKNKKVATWITRIGSVVGLILIFGIFSFNSYLYPKMYQSPWQVWVGSAILPIIGFIIGYIVASICRVPHSARRAIGIETGVQNAGVCIALAAVSYETDIYVQVTVVPVLYATIGMPIYLISIGLYRCQRVLRRRYGAAEDEKNAEISKSAGNQALHEKYTSMESQEKESTENGVTQKDKDNLRF